MKKFLAALALALVSTAANAAVYQVSGVAAITNIQTYDGAFFSPYNRFTASGVAVGATELGALAAAAASVLLSALMWWFASDFPFMNRMLVVFFAALILAVLVSIARPQTAAANRIETRGLGYATSGSFNVLGLGVILILIALYATWW